MKRIWVAGCSGSGKTTIALSIGKKYNIPVFHRDNITWAEDSSIRSEEEQISIIKNITKEDRWIFDGTRFTASIIDGRLARCDTLIYLDINRFTCLARAFKRSVNHWYKNNLPKNERQYVTLDLIKYILYQYPKKKKEREDIFVRAKDKGINFIMLKGVKNLKRWQSANISDICNDTEK